MELRNLRVFIEVVRQGGFTEAARSLFSTQSTVSKSVRALEEELGVPLLHRASRHVVPTDAGRIVLREAQRMLGLGEDILDGIAELKGLHRGTLRLGLPRLGAEVLFAPILSRFHARYPGIAIELHEAGSARLRDQLHSGELDMAGLMLPVSDEFEIRELASEPLLALVPEAHPLSRQPCVTLAELGEVPLILFETDFVLHASVTQAFRHQQLSPRVVLRTSQVAFMVELVGQGMGAALLPRMIAAFHARPGVTAIPIAGPITGPGTGHGTGSDLAWKMAMAWRRDAFLSHAAKALLEIASESPPRS